MVAGVNVDDVSGGTTVQSVERKTHSEFRPGNGGTGQAGPRRGKARERGASAVIVALLVPAIFAAAAMTIDLGRLINDRQALSNALDAGALGGTYLLPGDPAGARDAGVALAKANDPGADPAAVFWCVIASTGASKTPDTSQIPSVCNPGSTAGAKCDENICAIPCATASGNSCNTMTLTADKDVPFAVAPAIGVNVGNTGSLSSTACAGSCGKTVPNPMDVVLVGDRTGSMSDSDRNAMVAGIKSTLQTMDKGQKYVSLGTIHKSKTASCITEPSGDLTGKWIPVPFSNDYTMAPAFPGATPALNTSSTLVQGLNCLKKSSKGTFLAAPMKAAARYVLGLEPNNIASLPARAQTAKKAIIFETDGEPNETALPGTTSLADPLDLGTSNGATACNNLKTVAASAKAQGVLIVTVAFGDANTALCASGGESVRQVLAAASSPDSQGNASVADNDCATAAQRSAENSDGDFFFCAATGSELGPIFVSAVNAISPNTRLVRIPA